MNIIAFLILLVAPLTFLIWTVRFTRLPFSLLSAVPAAFLLLAVLAVNNDPSVQLPQLVPQNQTVTANTTSFNYQQVDVNYNLDSNVLTIFNYLTLAGVLVIAGVVVARISFERNE